MLDFIIIKYYYELNAFVKKTSSIIYLLQRVGFVAERPYNKCYVNSLFKHPIEHCSRLRRLFRNNYNKADLSVKLGGTAIN